MGLRGNLAKLPVEYIMTCTCYLWNVTCKKPEDDEQREELQLHDIASRAL